MIEVASRGVTFNAHLESLARKAIVKLGSAFNGVHLHVEPDRGHGMVCVAAQLSGGRVPYPCLTDCTNSCCMQALMDEYLRVMKDVGFNASMPLYIASGVATYAGAQGKAPQTLAQPSAACPQCAQLYCRVLQHRLDNCSSRPGE